MKRAFFAALAVIGAMAATAANAQSTCPYIAYGAVLTAAQWNGCFSAKQDTLGFTPLNKSGDAMTGLLVTTPSSALVSGFRLPPGVAPASPEDGDIWITNSGLFAQIDGATIGPMYGPTAIVQDANKFFAGPSTGSPAVPTWRKMVNADLPAVTGSGAVALATSPTLVTPTLGDATATSINKVAITAPATSATLALGNGTTLTSSSSTSVGRGQYLATNTNDNATAGNIGEYLESDVPFGSYITISTSGTAQNLTSIASIPAGDWDIQCAPTFTPSGAVTFNYIQASISTTSATTDLTKGRTTTYSSPSGSTTLGGNTTLVTVTSRFSLNAATTIYCVLRSQFTGTLTAYGILRARRVR